MTVPRREAEAIALQLAEGAGVIVRDRKGIGAPILGRIVKITNEHVLVDLSRPDGSFVRFERATGFALLPGDHERWQLAAPEGPASEEYGDLLIRQGRLQAERERINRELDLVSAVLETADRAAANAKGSDPA